MANNIKKQKRKIAAWSSLLRELLENSEKQVLLCSGKKQMFRLIGLFRF